MMPRDRMRALVARSFGAPEDFAIEDVPRPALQPGEVLVAVKAAAVNFVDALIAAGKYQVKPELPFTPGTEFAGEVIAMADDVRGVKLGDRICGSAFTGAFAEMAVLPAASTYRVPEQMGWPEAATFRVSNATAYHALAQRGHLQPGETVLVLGASGAVGYGAVQVAKALGARVIASASTPEKRALALSAGADVAIDSRAADWRDLVRRASPREGLDVVVDPIGGEATEPAFRSLGWGGRHLVIGFASGAIPALRTNLALVKGAALIGVDIRRFNLLEPGGADDHAARLFEWYRQGKLRPAPLSIFPFEQFAAALTAASSGQHVGRIVLDLTH